MANMTIGAAFEPVTVDLPRDILDALDTWIAGQTEPPLSRPDMIAYALRDWLTGLGLLPFHDDREGAH